MSKITAFLSGCAASATAIIAVSLLTGAKAPPTRFDEIDVGRINVREPDGTLRLVISNRAQFPGLPWKGSELARPDRTAYAGMIFVNDEGTENGGFIQNGQVGSDGKPNAGLSLTFDRFRQDQVIQLLHDEQGGHATSTLAINDEPDGMRSDVLQRMERLTAIRRLPPADRQAAMQQLRDEGLHSANRVRLGTTKGKAAALTLSDAQGRPRLTLMVTPDGKPSIQLLDDQGQPARTIDLDTKQ